MFDDAARAYQPHPSPDGGPVPAPGTLSTAEVAARFGVTRRAVTQWARSGRLPYVRTDLGHHRFRTSDVDELLGAAVEARHEQSAAT